jgi:hypothetical protein
VQRSADIENVKRKVSPRGMATKQKAFVDEVEEKIIKFRHQQFLESGTGRHQEIRQDRDHVAVHVPDIQNQSKRKYFSEFNDIKEKAMSVGKRNSTNAN